MKQLRTLLALSLLAVVPAVAAVTSAAHAESRKHEPKVSIDDARAKALSLVPGEVKAEELERERGRWIYSFEIKPTGETRRIIKEVNIDADTGVLVGKVETERE